jgi:hypothetical protein
MRRLSAVALLLVGSMIAAPEARAQLSISLAAGAALPMGDAADALEMGYNATLGVGFKPPLAPVGLRVEAMLNSFAYKENTLGFDSQRLLGVTANATFGAPALPLYAIGGVGMYSSKLSADAFDPDAENDIGFNIGAGFNIPLTGFGTFIEVRYHHVPGDGGAMKFVPITVGIKF